MLELTLLPFADRLVALTIAAWISFLLVLPQGVQHFLLLDRLECWLMNLFSLMERKLNRLQRPKSQRRLRGWIVAIITLVLALFMGSFISRFTIVGGWYVMAEIAIIALIFSFWRPLFLAREIARLLQSKKEKDREVVPLMLRRLIPAEVNAIDTHGILRLLVEGMGMHLATRAVSATFWYLLLGLPGLILSSLLLMLAGRWHFPENRYAAFGTAFRLLAKVFFFIPERLTSLIFLLASAIAPRCHPADAASALVKPVTYPAQGALVLTTLAGALHISLGGPRTLEGETVKLPWIDFGPARIEFVTLRQMQWIYGISIGILVLIISSLNLLR